MPEITMTGQIIRDGEIIAFQIDYAGCYHQWGNRTGVLGENVDLMQAIAAAVYEATRGQG